ncbi:hypothetical protein [Sedimentibacter sp.]|uniref:hypothetical protein n=1 Tax=Sedimentibacter sp. TaxID=1960295 RepID=UPI0028AFF32D|nr:hypothetical protein [Sedimentibacter sp.]
MARRRNMYSKRKRINYGRIFLLLLILVVLIALVFKLFKKNDYIGVVEEALNSKIIQISGSVNSVSDVDYSVYSNDGIRYSNQHENIIQLNIIDGTNTEDKEKANDVKRLFDNLIKSDAADKVKELSLKESGYYWVDAKFIVEDRKLFIKDENEYNFDLYYDIEEKTVYIKEKYYNEFSKKNNKTELQGYSATDEFVGIIERLVK